MLATVVGSMAATIARESGDAPPAGTFASALIGSGVSLIGRKDRRAVGLILVGLGGLLLWRQAVAAERRDPKGLKPVQGRPAPAGATVSAA